MTLLYREPRQKQPRLRSQRIPDASGTFTGGATTKSRSSLAISNLTISDVARRAVVEQDLALRIGKYKRRAKTRPTKSMRTFLQQVDSVCASNPIVLRKIKCRDGTVYPLRTEVTVIVKHTVKTAEAFIHELKWLESLFGKGTSDELAIAAFSESFHHLVKKHHRKPPHLRTAEDSRINRVLDHLIDWRRFDMENPLEQPLWGRIGKRDEHGRLSVYWVIGPSSESDKESKLLAHDVVDEFDGIGEGHWFYGAGRVFPDRIEWTSLPIVAPDPHDEAAVNAAWDLIPSHVMSDLNAWPLKKGG
jgi:hypothetical protein